MKIPGSRRQNQFQKIEGPSLEKLSKIVEYFYRHVNELGEIRSATYRWQLKRLKMKRLRSPDPSGSEFRWRGIDHRELGGALEKWPLAG